MKFHGFPKIARFSREIIITEKIDGTNACITIAEIPKLSENDPNWPSLLEPEKLDYWYKADGTAWGIWAGSRTRWITPENDNYGFAKWVKEHIAKLTQLGPGTHFGEWWGQGIQRNYGLKEKRFSLFNVQRWCLHNTPPQRIPSGDPKIEKYQQVLPKCCGLVPIIYKGEFTTDAIDAALLRLQLGGSFAVQGFKNPEGIVVYHTAGNIGFKKTLEKDEKSKQQNKE